MHQAYCYSTIRIQIIFPLFYFYFRVYVGYANYVIFK